MTTSPTAGGDFPVVGCLLCAVWERMPYAKRHTTPTTAQETEAALVIGYWTCSRKPGQVNTEVARICERHINILNLLDRQEQTRVEVEMMARARLPPIDYQARVEELKGRLTTVQPSAPLPSSGTVTPPPPVPNAEPVVKQNGPTVTPNEVIATTRPDANWKGWYCTNHPPGEHHANNPDRQLCWGCNRPQGNSHFDPVKAALEAAKMPPQQGAKIEFPCPLCGKTTTTGEIHVCKDD